VKTFLTSSLPDLWLYVLGGLFIAVTLFLPRGLVGSISAFDLKLPALGSMRPPAPALSRRSGDD
jgi:urea transport system permease protein